MDIEVNEFDWDDFEQQFEGTKRTDVSEVMNIYRHPCKLFVHNNDLNLWNSKIKSNNTDNMICNINVYEITHKKKWVKLRQLP
jgi:hypothetical protein